MIPLIPAVIVLLGGTAAGTVVYRDRQKKMGVMTPERQKVYDAALNTLTDPVKLRSLATAFEKEGFKEQGETLRKRANLRELPDDVKASRRKVFKKTLQSNNPAAVEAIAKAFEKEGAVGAAAKLRAYAAGLTKKKAA